MPMEIGMGNANNSIGGLTFQFRMAGGSSAKPKTLPYMITTRLVNGGYQSDFEQGENNMNEEWFGICAKGPLMCEVYTLYPRAAYYALKKVHDFDPYASGASSASLESYF